MNTNNESRPPMDDPNSLPARLARLTGGDPSKTQPKHVRMMGGYCVFAGIAFVGLNAHSMSNDGTLWPQAILLFPTLLLLGLWMLVDATALATGHRRFSPGLWVCIGAGSALGSGVIHMLTGRWF